MIVASPPLTRMTAGNDCHADAQQRIAEEPRRNVGRERGNDVTSSCRTEHYPLAGV